MAKNDSIIIDSIIDERVELKQPSDKRDEVFEYFATEQILKDLNLDTDEILVGSIDGRNDGGIDGFYIFVNGHHLTDADSFFWPKSNTELDIRIITCKHHDTFKQSPLDNLTATLSEILDLSIRNADLKGDYNDELLKYRDILKTAYKKVSPRLTSFAIEISYASRGDTSTIGESIKSRANQIKNIVEQSFAGCSATFSFYGGSELVTLNRKIPNFALELPFQEVFSRGERYVLLTKIEDYRNFVVDDNKKLRRYLFDSNVRDFMGLNSVNEDIKTTLENSDSPDFWWLNNGITILATSARVIGSTIHIEDIQIVNGLQTTESIFKFFESGGRDPKERSVLVKVLVTNDAEVRDSIIRATNNQTLVEISALHATDKIQRDIEDILLPQSLYYERRSNHYVNQGMPSSSIITPLYLASGFVTLVLKQPHAGLMLKQKFMRSPESYNRIFSHSTPLGLWVQIAKILKLTDEFVEKNRTKRNSSSFTEGFLKRWRHITCFITVSRLLKAYTYSNSDLLRFNLNEFNEMELETTWKFLKTSTAWKNANNSKLKQEGTIIEILKRAAKEFEISGIEFFLARKKIAAPIPKKSKAVDPIILEKVNAALPEQPWKPGIHLTIAENLEISVQEVSDAINLLVASGKRLRQKDGITYDSNNQIVSIDKERVDNETLTLKDGSGLVI